MKYALTSRSASASSTLKISHEDAVKFCRVINRKKLVNAKRSLDRILIGKMTLDGRTYMKITEEMSKMLNQLESNARKKGLDPDNMFVFVSTHRGPTMHRGRRRWRKFGSRMKSCHVQLVLSDKDSFSKKEKKKETPKKENAKVEKSE
jgi:ribosomal protein L22